MAFIHFPEGKKVFTGDGEHIGHIEKVYISEFGAHMALIKTIFPEYPQFEILMTQLKSRIIKHGDVEEEVYILKNVPIKIIMLLEKRKEEEIRKQQEAQKIETQQIESQQVKTEEKEKEVVSEDKNQETILMITEEIRRMRRKKTKT